MKFIPNSVTRSVSSAILKGKKNSPSIMLGAGVVGVVSTAVLASRATLKLDDVLTEAEKDHDKASKLHAQNRRDYNDKDYNKDVAIIQAQTAIKIVKLYTPAIVVGAASIACLVGSHRILTKRNAALAAAYTTLETSFREYQKRVVEELGADKEREIRYNVKEVPVTDPVSGEVAVVKQAGDSIHSPYARLFDSTNKHWDDMPDYNRATLHGNQQWANDMLRARGHVLLNDVYGALGFDRTTEGCVVGWIWNGDGDNYIDFGLGDRWADDYPEYLRGKNGAVWLDFNVDGVIYDKI